MKGRFVVYAKKDLAKLGSVDHIEAYDLLLGSLS